MTAPQSVIQGTISSSSMTVQGQSRGPSSARITSLDGLRGAAALIVVFHHIGLAVQPFAGGTLLWKLLMRTPLVLLISGHQAVLIFFVLSGLVVTAQPIRKAGFSWVQFLTSRIVRLYIPGIVAVCISALLVVALPRDPSVATPGSWLAKSSVTVFDPSSFFNELSLMLVAPRYDNVLWSLRWEIIFSLLLPVYAVLASTLQRRFWTGMAGATAISVAGALLNQDALYIPPLFLIGALLSTRLDALRRAFTSLRPRRRAAMWSALLAGAILALITPELLAPYVQYESIAWCLANVVVPVGAAGIVAAAVGFHPFQRLLDTRPFQWLGRVSFSVYLIHVPILTSTVYAIGEAHWKLVAVLGLGSALLFGAAFYRLVERPSHRWAQRLGRWALSALPSDASAPKGPSLQRN